MNIPARVIEKTETPIGTAGVLIECTCATHKVGETRAIVTDHPAITAHLDARGIHGFVSNAAENLTKQFNRGPWLAV